MCGIYHLVPGNVRESKQQFWPAVCTESSGRIKKLRAENITKDYDYTVSTAAYVLGFSINKHSIGDNVALETDVFTDWCQNL